MKRPCVTAAFYSVVGIGGVSSWEDAVQFLLCGAHTVQVCTGAMLQGYSMIDGLLAGLAEFMERHDFEHVSDMVGKSLPFFTTHADLVARQKEAKREKAGETNRDGSTWQGDIAKETDSLVTD